MKNVRFRKSAIVCILLMLVMVSTGISVNASDDDIDFSFTLKANYANSYSYGRYRQTTSKYNPWKVNLAYSSEGAGTKARFWLANSNTFDRCSETYIVTQGSGDHYYSAWENAAEKRVSLGCENNNDTSKSYTVSGYWDEETW